MACIVEFNVPLDRVISETGPSCHCNIVNCQLSCIHWGQKPLCPPLHKPLIIVDIIGSLTLQLLICIAVHICNVQEEQNELPLEEIMKAVNYQRQVS